MVVIFRGSETGADGFPGFGTGMGGGWRVHRLRGFHRVGRGERGEGKEEVRGEGGMGCRPFRPCVWFALAFPAPPAAWLRFGMPAFQAFWSGGVLGGREGQRPPFSSLFEGGKRPEVPEPSHCQRPRGKQNSAVLAANGERG
jgi:hypothetical protein